MEKWNSIAILMASIRPIVSSRLTELHCFQGLISFSPVPIVRQILIDLSIRAGAKGIVIAGVGNGNMNAAMLAASKKAADNGIVVVRSTRVPTGYVLRNAEINDDENNTIASDELNAQKSRVLLMLALLKQRDNSNIQELFYKY